MNCAAGCVLRPSPGVLSFTRRISRSMTMRPSLQPMGHQPLSANQPARFPGYPIARKPNRPGKWTTLFLARSHNSRIQNSRERSRILFGLERFDLNLKILSEATGAFDCVLKSIRFVQVEKSICQTKRFVGKTALLNCNFFHKPNQKRKLYKCSPVWQL